MGNANVGDDGVNVWDDIGDVHDDIDNVHDDIDNVHDDIGNVHNDIDNIHDDIGNVLNDIGSVHNDIGNVYNNIGNVRNNMGSVLYISNQHMGKIPRFSRKSRLDASFYPDSGKCHFQLQKCQIQSQIAMSSVSKFPKYTEQKPTLIQLAISRGLIGLASLKYKL